MNSLLERLMGVDTLTDQVIAMDLLTSAKSAIQMCAVAVTESATPDVKAALNTHLAEAIEMHAKVTDYMMKRGLYHPYNIGEQIRLDQKTVRTALNIPS